MSTEIHPSAIVDSRAQLADGVTVGPFAVIGPHAQIGPDCEIGPRVLIEGHVSMGARNRVMHCVTIGGPPQDLKFAPGTRSYISIGDDNVIREYASIHPSNHADGVTSIANRTMIMAYAHVAHDCDIRDEVILANAVSLAGHILIDERAAVGGNTAVHQFVNIGQASFVGGLSAVRMDVLPFVKVSGIPCRAYGINVIGLKRRGLPRETISALRQAYRTMMHSGLTLPDAIATIRARDGHIQEVETFLTFAEASTRGLIRERHMQ